MKKQYLYAWVFVLLFSVLPASAFLKSIQVCQDDRLPNNSTLDCTYVDTSEARRVSAQINCHNDGTVALNVSSVFVGGSAAGTGYMAIPQTHIDGSTGLIFNQVALPSLHANFSSENTWSTLAGYNIPLTPTGTLRLTNHTDNSLSLVDCTAILNLGD